MQGISIIFSCVEGAEYPSDFDDKKVRDWLMSTAADEGKQISKLHYILCDDSYLLDLNNEYLNHDTLTDIITFPYANDPIEAEMYISIERVVDNAKTYNDGETSGELRRVIVHGLLHMCGYSDHDAESKAEMRDVEAKYLHLF